MCASAELAFSCASFFAIARCWLLASGASESPYIAKTSAQARRKLGSSSRASLIKFSPSLSPSAFPCRSAARPCSYILYASKLLVPASSAGDNCCIGTVSTRKPIFLRSAMNRGSERRLSKRLSIFMKNAKSDFASSVFSKNSNAESFSPRCR